MIFWMDRIVVFETSGVVRMLLFPFCTSRLWLTDLKIKDQHFSVFVKCSAS